MNRPTDDSRPGFSPTVPMPRMRAEKLTSLVAPDTSSEGATCPSARTSLAPVFSSVSPVTAETAIGTSDNASLRRVAVTMIVSSFVSAPASCAVAGAAHRAKTSGRPAALGRSRRGRRGWVVMVMALLHRIFVRESVSIFYLSPTYHDQGAPSQH